MCKTPLPSVMLKKTKRDSRLRWNDGESALRSKVGVRILLVRRSPFRPALDIVDIVAFYTGLIVGLRHIGTGIRCSGEAFGAGPTVNPPSVILRFAHPFSLSCIVFGH